MRIALLLFGYAVALAGVGVWWLPRASWPVRAPWAGIAVWQALTVTVVISVVLAGLALAVPASWHGWGPAGMVQACVVALRAQYATPAGAAAGVAGAGLALAVLGRLAWSAGSVLARAARRRARHHDTLALVARPGPATDVLLLDHDQPAAYCVPGSRRVVLSTGALRCLNGAQLEAVLAHERAHLKQRHHLVLAFAAVVGNAFPRLQLFRVAAGQFSRLVEMAADDAAARRASRLALAQALLTLAAARVPAGALGASGTVAGQRVRRLIEPPGRPARARRALTSAALVLAVSTGALSVPVAAAAAALAACSAHPASAARHPAAVGHTRLAPGAAEGMTRAAIPGSR